MPIETWFPTPVFFEDLVLEQRTLAGALEAVRARAEEEGLAASPGLTAGNARNDLHFDARMAPLIAVLGKSLRHFLFDLLRFDPDRVDFHLGRCWPVVQGEEGDGAGTVHIHRGATFSAVFYLAAPPGSGSLEIYSPVDWPHVGLELREESALTYRQASYEARAGRLIVFPSTLRHRRLAGETGPGERLAIAFDLYATASIDAATAGMPHAEHWKKL